MLRKTTRSGFTLIELLVVIAIIAILAAILFPVFARARENARRSSCQSNLKPLALGVMQYSQDYDERFPSYANASGQNGWSMLTQPYLKSLQILQCPSDSGVPTLKVDGTPDDVQPGYVDYAYNVSLGWSDVGTVQGRALSSVTDAVRTVLLCDESGNVTGSNSQHWSAGCAGTNNSSSCTAGLATFRSGSNAQLHLDGQNYAFVDGHVKWFKAAGTTQSAKVYNFWVTDANTPTSAGSPTFNYAP
jgi:prepilin-type N-terminal cleavage/methylation domain-containing protein/prepilin-type processing-associated H-X9-DG protein